MTLLHLALHIVVFSGSGLFLYSIRSRLGLIPFYIYLGILQVFTSLMSSFYILDVGYGIQVGGGSIAYAAVLWAVMLLYLVERDLSTIKVTILGLLAVQFVFLILYPYYGFILEFAGAVNPLEVSGEVFDVGFGIFLVGNFLAFLEMLLMIFLLEKTKERMPSMPGTISVVIIYVMTLLLDAVLFPALAFPVTQSISIVQGISSIISKLMMGVGYGVMLIVATAIVKSHYLRDRNGTRVEFRDMFTLPKSEVIEAWLKAEQNQQRVKLLLDLISHDIQNTSNKVMQLVEIAELKAENSGKALPKEVLKIHEIERESSELVDNVLTLSMIEREQLETDKLALLEILERARLRVDSFHADVAIRLNGAETLEGVKVESHHLLESVFHNILSNMIKYRKDDQDEVVVDISCEREGDSIHLIMMDSGIGIPDDRKEIVFDSLKTRPRHRGFGLYLVKQILLELDSKIWITNRPDHPEDYSAGTAFHMLLPL